MQEKSMLIRIQFWQNQLSFTKLTQAEPTLLMK